MGGKVSKIAPDGGLLHEFGIAAGFGTTNVAFGRHNSLFVSAVKDPDNPKARGSIVRIADLT